MSMSPKAPPSGRAADAGGGGGPRSRGLFERFPEGLVLVGEDRRVLSLNESARRLLGLDEHQEKRAWTCCELVCGAIEPPFRLDGMSCITRYVLGTGQPLPAVQTRDGGDGGGASLSVTADRVDAEDVRVLLRLERATGRPRGVGQVSHEPSAVEDPRLRVHTLGGTRVEFEGEPLGGEWLEQRAGLLLKYLVCRRRGVVPSDQIAEALWPGAAPREALTSLRHYVHVLRQKLEPHRPKRAASSFIKTHGGGYRLDAERVWIDAEELEVRAGDGLRLFMEGQPGSAADALEGTMLLYAGEFLADAPDADWVLEERERLHHLAAKSCAALIEIKLAAADVDSAAEYSRRLADMEPLDTGIQRQFIELCLRQGRGSDAARRYDLLRTRTRRELGTEPGFTLEDLTS